MTNKQTELATYSKLVRMKANLVHEKIEKLIQKLNEKPNGNNCETTDEASELGMASG